MGLSTFSFQLEKIDQNFRRKRQEQRLQLAIQEAFLRFMGMLLRGYGSHLLPVKHGTKAADPTSLFDMAGTRASFLVPAQALLLSGSISYAYSENLFSLFLSFFLFRSLFLSFFFLFIFFFLYFFLLFSFSFFFLSFSCFLFLSLARSLMHTHALFPVYHSHSPTQVS